MLRAENTKWKVIRSLHFIPAGLKGHCRTVSDHVSMRLLQPLQNGYLWNRLTYFLRTNPYGIIWTWRFATLWSLYIFPICKIKTGAIWCIRAHPLWYIFSYRGMLNIFITKYIACLVVSYLQRPHLWGSVSIFGTGDHQYERVCHVHLYWILKYM